MFLKQKTGKLVKPWNKRSLQILNKKTLAASKRRNERIENSSDEEGDEQDELASSDSGSDSDSDVNTNKRKRKTVSKKRRNVASKVVIDTSSQLLEPVSESALNTQDSLYGI